MADYRFSAQPISRGKGQSSVASAAYRSASRLVDARTGEIHDYTRKVGVIHSEILAPEGAPAWMSNRPHLWNAVEAVEQRRDAQLAREIQMSLPHELTGDQRRALVREFVKDQFVSRGMIADIAIHLPDKQGDGRNHHAHVLLSLREVTGEGFGKKDRSWNDKALLRTWRERWADHQNRTLERHGHKARVDHRSFEARGIDREPTYHRGPAADGMEKAGKRSRIGEENRAIEARNTARAQAQAALVRTAEELAREQAKRTARHGAQRRRLEAELELIHGRARQTIAADLAAVERRLQARGARKVLRDLFGRTKADMRHQQILCRALKRIRRDAQIRRDRLARNQQAERRNTETSAPLNRWQDRQRAARGNAQEKEPDPSLGDSLRAEYDKLAKDTPERPERQGMGLRRSRGPSLER